MIRRILCLKCGAPAPTHPEDAAAGWRTRSVYGRAIKPDEHFLTINGERFDLPSLVCDQCGEKLKERERILAMTMWNTNRESEPGNWEKEYFQP